MNLDTIQVQKASGKLEAFSEEKIRRSLSRAGARPKTINTIINKLLPNLHHGITTKQIYQQVYELLNQHQFDQSYNYSLKEALMRLGPSGFPFEKFIGRLFEKLGYQVTVSSIIPGRCLEYEIDVVATKDNQRNLIECKYHNHSGTKTSSKDALCLQAKFEDIGDYDHAWLVTNTKLTESAIKYGECKGIKMLAWRYPVDNGLETLIEKFNLQPITTLSFLSHQDQHFLIQHNIVVISDLVNLTPAQINDFGFEPNKAQLLTSFISSHFDKR